MKINTLTMVSFISLLTLNNISLGYCQDIEKQTDNKAKYNIFNPTPPEKMRELNTDRPDKTESPYTVDAGHFQFETDIVNYTRNTNGNELTNSFSFLNMSLKEGLTNFTDFQLIIPAYNTVNTASRYNAGFGDIVTRLKINIFGNDQDFAMGIIPFIKFPTNQNNLGNKAFEGGLVFPFALNLPLGFTMGFMGQWNYNKNANNDFYHSEFISSFTFGHKISGILEAYAEFFSQNTTEQGVGWIATADFGLTWPVLKNLQFDAGINIGLTPASDNFNTFTGISFRL